MSNNSLTKLTIKNLRGAASSFTLGFQNKKPLTIIYGENGAGKSTICDALEFLGKGKVGSIEGKGLGRTASYWASIGKKNTDISVCLESNEGICIGKVSSSTVFVEPAELKPKIEVLRRSQITDLVEASPGDRYKSISKFIDISSIEESEKNLIKLIKSLKEKKEVSLARLEENHDTILSSYNAAGGSGDPIEWATIETRNDISGLQKEVAALGELRRSHESLDRQIEKFKQAVHDLISIEAEMLQAESDLANIVDSKSDSLLGLLESAQLFFNENSSQNECPLCQSSEKVEKLSEHVAQRISELSNLKSLLNAKNQAKRQLETKTTQFELAKQELQSAADLFGKACRSESIDPELISFDHFDWSNISQSSIELLDLWVNSISPYAKKYQKSEREKGDSQYFLTTLKEAVQSYQDNFNVFEDVERLIPRLERGQVIISEERRKFTDGILSQIADEVGRLYESIHPGEGLNKISLQLDPRKRASLDIKTDFYSSTEIPPQAYFSESHLDTLGFCIFLAVSALSEPEKTILVLDDILASVDEPHVERVIHLLYEEAKRFQHCIVTTHYRPWKEKLRWGWLKNSQCHFVELGKWNSEQGIKLARSTPEVHRLRTLLEAEDLDPQLVCAKSGVILEAALDFLTKKYECKVPRREGNRYTLGDLLPPIKGPLKTALKIEVKRINQEDNSIFYEEVVIGELVGTLQQISQARNVMGAHFNTLSFELLESDAILFGRTVLDLAEALICTECGWPTKNKGSYWTTPGGNETRRLYPVCVPG